MRKISKSAFAVLCVGAIASIFGAGARAQAPTTIEFGVTSLVALEAVHFIAEEKKFYEAENLKVETFVGGSAAAVIQQIGGGSLDAADVATNQTMRGIMRGAPIKIIAGSIGNASFRLLGAKGVKGWGDLKGKTISVGGPTDETLYFLRIMARKNGLSDNDYDLIYAGTSPDRFAQLASGGVAATMLGSPFDFTALDQGYVDLGSVPDYLPNWAQDNIVVNTAWMKKNHAAAVALMRARVRATDYFYDPKNRDDVIQILAKYTKSSVKSAADTYDLYVKEQLISPKAALDESGLQDNLDAFVQTGEIKSAPPVSDFTDASVIADAVK